MGFITLEDLTGQIECLVFPKVYEKYQGLMAPDDLVVLCGKLSIREEEAPKLLLDKLVPLEAWEEKPKVAIPDEPGNKPHIPAGEHTPAQPRTHHAPPQPQLSDAQLAARAARKLFIQLERSQMDEAVRQLSLHPGSIPVYLHIPAEKMTFLLPSLQWCDGGEGCMKRLPDAFGPDNVKMVEKK